MQFDRVPIRCQLDIISNPPVQPIDANTGEEIRFFRAQDMSVQVGIFQPDLESVDLANVVTLELALQTSQNALYAALKSRVGAIDIIPTIARGAWIEGTAQQASFLLTAAELDLALGAEESLPYWMVVRGLTVTGQTIIYGAGWVRLYNSGQSNPIPMAGVVSKHTQTNNDGDSDVEPTAVIHTEVITFGGVARTSKVIIDSQPFYGIPGAQVILIVVFDDPAIDAIVVQVYNQNDDGDPVLVVRSDGFQPNAKLTFVADGVGGLAAVSQEIPAFTTPA